MFILSFIRGLYKALSADAAPSAIATGIAFGALLGCVPITSRVALLLILLIAVVRLQLSSAVFAWGLTRLASFAGLSALFNPVGEALLEPESMHGFWVWALNLPVIAWLGLERHAILGGLVVGVALGVALWGPVRYAVIAYRRWAKERLGSSRFFRWLVNFWVVKALRFVFVGTGR